MRDRLGSPLGISRGISSVENLHVGDSSPSMATDFSEASPKRAGLSYVSWGFTLLRLRLRVATARASVARLYQLGVSWGLFDLIRVIYVTTDHRVKPSLAEEGRWDRCLNHRFAHRARLRDWLVPSSA